MHGGGIFFLIFPLPLVNLLIHVRGDHDGRGAKEERMD